MEENVSPILLVKDAARAVQWYERLGFIKEAEHRQYRALKQDEVDGLQVLGHRGASGGGLFWRERPMEAQPVDRSKGLDREQLAGNEGFTRPQILEGARLAEHEPQQHRSVKVSNHPDARSWSRTVRLLVVKPCERTPRK